MNNPVCIHTISIVIVMMMVVMMHQCTSSALRPASSPCPPIPPTVELYSLMARGRRGGHKGILQSVGIPPLSPKQLLWLPMTACRMSDVVQKSQQFGPSPPLCHCHQGVSLQIHSKPVTHDLCYYWKLIFPLSSIKNGQGGV